MDTPSDEEISRVVGPLLRQPVVPVPASVHRSRSVACEHRESQRSVGGESAEAHVRPSTRGPASDARRSAEPPRPRHLRSQCEGGSAEGLPSLRRRNLRGRPAHRVDVGGLAAPATTDLPHPSRPCPRAERLQLANKAARPNRPPALRSESCQPDTIRVRACSRRTRVYGHWCSAVLHAPPNKSTLRMGELDVPLAVPRSVRSRCL
jgi:hypothetical protein